MLRFSTQLSRETPVAVVDALSLMVAVVCFLLFVWARPPSGSRTFVCRLPPLLEPLASVFRLDVHQKPPEKKTRIRQLTCRIVKLTDVTSRGQKGQERRQRSTDNGSLCSPHSRSASGRGTDDTRTVDLLGFIGCCMTFVLMVNAHCHTDKWCHCT